MTWCDPRGSLKRALVGAVALAALLAGAGVVTQSCARATSNGFVTRSGDTLQLNGRGFRFSGANIYWGGLDDDGRIGLNYPTPFRFTNWLDLSAPHDSMTWTLDV